MGLSSFDCNLDYTDCTTVDSIDINLDFIGIVSLVIG
jgi:hypothetical protein